MIKFVRDLWALTVERHRTRAALRVLVKQQWSLEFLEALLKRCADRDTRTMQLEITNNFGQTIVLRHVNDEATTEQRVTDSIFDHLDSDVAIRQFMQQAKIR